MNDLAKFYNEFSEVLNYPYEGYKDKLENSNLLLQNLYPDESENLSDFYKFVQEKKDTELEELYVRTFDVQAVCCLDVGYAMFGEDYKRGQFMAELKGMYRDHQLETNSELPDFLPNILKLLTHLEYGDACELVSSMIVPAIDKMIESFKENEGNVYRYPLIVISNILKRDYMVQ